MKFTKIPISFVLVLDGSLSEQEVQEICENFTLTVKKWDVNKTVEEQDEIETENISWDVTEKKVVEY